MMEFIAVEILANQIEDSDNQFIKNFRDNFLNKNFFIELN